MLDPTLQGLSEQEVAARRTQGLSNIMPTRTSRSYIQIIRENVFNPINNILYILGLALIALGKVSDALISIGVVLLNVIVSLIQEIRAKRTLDRIALLTRPKTTVMRAGKELTIDPDEVVVGDVLVIRPGDQIVVDGPILTQKRIDVDESLLTGESELVAKQQGDDVSSGSFCVNGTALYQAARVGEQSVAYKLAAGARAFRRVYTPLQRQINLVLRVILFVAIFFEFLLCLSALTEAVPLVDFIQRSVVIIGIVPIGLFLTITVSYTLGAVRIVGQGALIQQANAIESLSHVDVLCMDKTGTLTTNSLQLVAVLPFAQDETTIRGLLGDFVVSGSTGNTTSEAIGAACTGHKRRTSEEIPFSSTYKWSGLAFDDETIRGTYILGAVEMLEPALRPGKDITTLVTSESEKGLRVLLFAYVPELVPLRNHDDQPVLPPGLLPLSLVTLRDELRPDARETLAKFTQAGIRFKVISGDNPQTVAALAIQAGLASSMGVISGLDLAQMDAAQLSQAAEEATVFGRITPQQKEQLVEALRKRGHYIAMMGDGVNDVLSLKKANLGIAMQSGSQATRGVADIVLLNDSFASLPSAFQEGQRIRNGMQNILKIYLSRVLYVALLLLEILVIGGFPYAPKQASLLTLLTVGLPTLVLAAWARPGLNKQENGQRSLWRFVLPAALTVGLVALFIYLGEYLVHALLVLTPRLGGNITYNQLLDASMEAQSASRAAAQSALTTFTIVSGIVLLLFVEPPSRFWTGGNTYYGEKRITILALCMLLIYVTLLLIPPLRKLFDLTLLGIYDYLIIGALIVIWLFLLRWVWRARLLEKFLELG
jgi:cation-transporting ATPase E